MSSNKILLSSLGRASKIMDEKESWVKLNATNKSALLLLSCQVRLIRTCKWILMRSQIHRIKTRVAPMNLKSPLTMSTSTLKSLSIMSCGKLCLLVIINP